MKKITAIGHALCDILCHIDDQFLQDNNLAKNAMMLTDGDYIDQYLSQLSVNNIQAGGSAANTIAGVAMLGGDTSFFGLIGDDDFGRQFSQSLLKLHVKFDDKNACQHHQKTGRCLILVSHDGARTMLTDLSVSHDISAQNLKNISLNNDDIIYLEGYLFDTEHNKEAFIHIAQQAKQSNAQIALTLSDGFCVDRHRDDFMSFIKNYVDILFANDNEIMSLWQDNHLDDALNKQADICALNFITCGEKGAYVVFNHMVRHVAAIKVDKVVDTTGAGDLFAAGVLYGITQFDNTQSYQQQETIDDYLNYCHLGCKMASITIADYGARPIIDKNVLL